MRLKKRIGALIVALCMVLGLCVVVDSNVKAADNTLTIKINLKEGTTPPQNWGLDYKFRDDTGVVFGDAVHIGISGASITAEGYTVKIPENSKGIQITEITTADALVGRITDNEGTLKVGDMIDFTSTTDNQEISFTFESKQQDPPPPGQEPSGDEEPEPETRPFVFRLNGKTITEPDISKPILGDFGDLSDLDNINLEILRVGDIELKNVGTKSGVKDSEGRPVLEVNTIGSTKESIVLRIHYHATDDPNNDLRAEFELVKIEFRNSSMKGVEISSDHLPDMYDDTVFSDNVDFAGSSVSNPSKAVVYYAASFTDFEPIGSTAVSKIELVGNMNPKAVTIVRNRVEYNSPFYNSIPLKITLADGSEGYVTIEKLGLELSDYINANGVVQHGSQPGGNSISMSGNAKESNLAVTFYYNNTNSYRDYNIVATLTFADGSVRTVVAEGFGEKTGARDPEVMGGDYLVWSGARSEAPISISATAVAAGAMNNANSFGGAMFGAGVGAFRDLRRY